ncbi:MAG: fasciclin domain-containing protein [Burkholderiales bacterium]
MKNWLHLLAAVASAGLLAACGGGGSDGSSNSAGEPATLAAVANAEPSVSEFMKLAETAGMTQKLLEDGQMTLIAPSNEAMAEMSAEIEELKQPQNRQQLQSFVESHLVAKRMFSSDMQTGTETAVSGSAIEVNLNSSGASNQSAVTGAGIKAASEITLNDARIKVADVAARNGVLFVTYKPLWRPSVFTYVKYLPTFSILEKAIREAGLVDALRSDGPFTVFAPTDVAFAALLAELKISADQLLANKALLTDVLTYHVLPQKLSARQVVNGATPVTLQGQAITFDVQRRAGADVRILDSRGRQANVIATNLFARNGVVHVIDKVILPQSKNVVQIAQGISDFSILVDAVVAAGLVDTLSGAGPFTVFAPTNAAFAALLDELKVTKEALLADKVLLTKVLTYHVLPGRVLASDIKEGAQATTVQGETFTLSLMGGANITDARNRKANIVATNVQASNGVIHVIDKVILPKTDAPSPPPAKLNIVQVAQSLPDFSILVEAVVAAGLADTLSGTGPFTVFAPNNAAFAALLGELKLTKEQLLANKGLLTAVLTYHVLPGRVLAADIKEGAQATTVQGQLFTLGLQGGASITDAQGRKANIVATDVAASNGVIHVVDKVILPQTKNIVEIALSLSDFSILVEAVLAAELQGTLSGTGPFTVFAPTNAAFASLLHELRVTKSQLLADKALLTKVLTYHVLSTRVLAKDVTDGLMATTVQGQQFTLNKVGSMLHILDARHRGANVVATDVQASNGVIHVIDRVLLPKP